jgi:hypothetical protein
VVQVVQGVLYCNSSGRRTLFSIAAGDPEADGRPGRLLFPGSPSCRADPSRTKGPSPNPASRVLGRCRRFSTVWGPVLWGRWRKPRRRSTGGEPLEPSRHSGFLRPLPATESGGAGASAVASPTNTNVSPGPSPSQRELNSRPRAFRHSRGVAGGGGSSGTPEGRSNHAWNQKAEQILASPSGRKGD